MRRRPDFVVQIEYSDGSVRSYGFSRGSGPVFLYNNIVYDYLEYKTDIMS